MTADFWRLLFDRPNLLRWRGGSVSATSDLQRCLHIKNWRPAAERCNCRSTEINLRLFFFPQPFVILARRPQFQARRPPAFWNTRINPDRGLHWTRKWACSGVSYRAQANLDPIHFPIDLLLNHHLNDFQADFQVKIYICVIRTTSLIDMYQRNLKKTNRKNLKKTFFCYVTFLISLVYINEACGPDNPHIYLYLVRGLEIV